MAAGREHRGLVRPVATRSEVKHHGPVRLNRSKIRAVPQPGRQNFGDQHTPLLNRVSIEFARHVIHLTVIWITGRVGEACLRVALVTQKEGAMPNRNLWNKNVPRVEHDRRARDTRLRLEQIERQLVKRDAAGGSQYFRHLLLLLGNTAGSGQRRDRRTGSPNDRRLCHLGTPRPASVLIKQPVGYPLPSIGA